MAPHPRGPHGGDRLPADVLARLGDELSSALVQTVRIAVNAVDQREDRNALALIAVKTTLVIAGKMLTGTASTEATRLALAHICDIMDDYP